MSEWISREAVVQYLKGFSEEELNRHGNYGMITSSVLNKAERAISEMPDGWISINDRLPEEGVNVLTYGARPFYDCFYINRIIDKDEWLYDGVTHWMPLPSTEGLNDEK